jgi:hypothetical protein
MPEDTRQIIFNRQHKGQKFEERLQIVSRGWQLKWLDPMEHSQKLLYSYASGYFDKRRAREHPINLIDRGVSTVVPFLIEGVPKINVTTQIPNLKPTARRTQLAMNWLIDKKMKLSESVFIPAAIMSMFGDVYTRTFSENDRVINLHDEVIRLGTPKIALIDPADYIGDPAAKSREDFIIEGDVYRLPTDYARDIFDKPDSILPSGKLISKFSAEQVASGQFNWNQLNLRDYTVFQDIFIRDENIVVTIMPFGNKPVRLRTISYDGPGDSPYDHLGYKFFPGCPISIPPAWAWNDLDVTMNIMARTAREQAESQKNVIIAEPASKEVAKKIINAANMDFLVSSNPKGIQTVSVGGVNPENYNWMEFAETEFTKTGVSTDILGGRGSNSPTLGQEQMVYMNASRIIRNMFTRFENFMTSVVSKLAYYVWTDPLVHIPVIEKIPGLGEMPLVFSQSDVVGDFYDFVFNIKPHSSQRMGPEQMYQRMMHFMGSWVLPTAQLSMAQGAQIDIPTATQILADYAGLEDFGQYYKSIIPQEPGNVPFMMMPQPGQTGGGKRPKGGTGQTNDSFGATADSRLANSEQAKQSNNNNSLVI